jgi:hypothetical protein
MCDYSLHLLTSRPAKVGDKLVTTKFDNSITRGFAAVGDLTVAVEPAGDYEIVRQLPDANGECHHRIKSADEPHERAVKESQLRKSFDG